MNVDFRPIDLVTSDRRDAIRTDTCTFCKGPAVEFKDELSKREYAISGMCQTCQDGFFE